jgi:hypothetical protein
MPSTAPSVTPPARYSTFCAPLGSAFMPPGGRRLCAVRGAIIPKRRPQKDASPEPVPRTGAGKTSGVQPYSTALNMDWKKLEGVSVGRVDRRFGKKDFHSLFHHVETDVGRLAVDCREDEDGNSHERSSDEHCQLATEHWHFVHHRTEYDSDDTRGVDGQVVAVSRLDRKSKLAVLRSKDRGQVVACGICQ